MYPQNPCVNRMDPPIEQQIVSKCECVNFTTIDKNEKEKTPQILKALYGK